VTTSRGRERRHPSGKTDVLSSGRAPPLAKRSQPPAHRTKPSGLRPSAAQRRIGDLGQLAAATLIGFLPPRRTVR
jgi:hypothetical protein